VKWLIVVRIFKRATQSIFIYSRQVDSAIEIDLGIPGHARRVAGICCGTVVYLLVAKLAVKGEASICSSWPNSQMREVPSCRNVGAIMLCCYAAMLLCLAGDRRTILKHSLGPMFVRSSWFV
jgi:hypothetical protein